jgi:hypothetical protein
MPIYHQTTDGGYVSGTTFLSNDDMYIVLDAGLLMVNSATYSELFQADKDA